jgi:hypothetical protein
VFYFLLIIPHLVACVGLIAWAIRVQPGVFGDSGAEGSDGGGGLEPPLDPQPQGPSGGLPLDGDAVPPRRRLRVHERLADLYPRKPRRTHEPVQPRVPVEN